MTEEREMQKKLAAEMAAECCDGREPYWDDLDQNGKIERMRRIIKTLMGSKERISKLEYDFRRHIHSDGAVCSPVQSGGIGFIDPPGRGEDKYF